MKPELIVLRGNSGSGKSTVATALREQLGSSAALVQQDFVRRTVLREDGGGDNRFTAGLLAQMARHCLGEGYHVVLEGILDRERYSDMLESLWRSPVWTTHLYYFQIGFSETARRHALRPESAHFDVSQMRSWYREDDRLTFAEEEVIGETSTMDESVAHIMRGVRSRR
jgi:predicted kinase